MKRFLSLLCALLLLLSLSACGEPSVVEEGTCGKYAAWTLNSDGLLTISGRGSMEDFLFETTPWSSVRDRIKTVVIEDGITYLGDYSFEGCEKLETVTLPSGMDTMGVFVFANCPKLTTVTGTEFFTAIGANAFEGCESLTAVELNPALSSIGRCAFYSCTAIERLSVPETVTFVDFYAFYGWTDAQTISFAAPQANRAWNDSWDGESNAVIVWNS